MLEGIEMTLRWERGQGRLQGLMNHDSPLLYWMSHEIGRMMQRLNE